MQRMEDFRLRCLDLDSPLSSVPACFISVSPASAAAAAAASFGSQYEWIQAGTTFYETLPGLNRQGCTIRGSCNLNFALIL